MTAIFYFFKGVLIIFLEVKLVQGVRKEYLGRDLIFSSIILIHFFNLEIRGCSLVAPGTLNGTERALSKEQQSGC